MLVWSTTVVISFAQFTSDTLQNTVIQDVSGSEQSVPLSATTSDGKTYISWFDISSGSYVLRMQLLDALGNALWSASGMVVSNFPQNSALFRYDLAVDREDNAIVAFQDMRSGQMQIVTYKISPGGTQMWGDAGIMLIDSTSTGLSPAIVVTKTNDVVISWTASIGASRYVAYHKISSSGTLTWSRRITGTTKFSRPRMAPLADDDFVMLYVRETGNFPGVTSVMLAQRFDSQGNPVWSSPVQVSTKTISFFFFPDILDDGADGFYVVFNTSNPVVASLNDVYAQRIDASGNLWSAAGIQAATASDVQKLTGGYVYSAQQQGLYVALQILNSGQSNSGFSLQKFSVSGNTTLGANGKVVKPLGNDYFSPQGMADAGDGLIMIYLDNGGFNNKRIKAVKVDYDGNPIWNYDPTLCAQPAEKDDISCGAFHNQQTVVVWADSRLDLGIYAQNITSQGTFGQQVLAVDSKTEIGTLNIFPNPGRQSQLLIEQSTADNAWLYIRTTEGKIVYAEPHALHSGQNNIPLPVQLSSGLYLLELRTNTGIWQGRWICSNRF